MGINADRVLQQEKQATCAFSFAAMPFF